MVVIQENTVIIQDNTVVVIQDNPVIIQDKTGQYNGSNTGEDGVHVHAGEYNTGQYSGSNTGEYSTGINDFVVSLA